VTSQGGGKEEKGKKITSSHFFEALKKNFFDEIKNVFLIEMIQKRINIFFKTKIDVFVIRIATRIL
jgi:hypothetical protein